MNKNTIIKKKPHIPEIITKEWLEEQLKNLNQNGIIDYRQKHKFMYDYKYYLDQIYNTNDINDFEPELEFCENDMQKDTWLFFRLKISSFEYSSIVGRCMKILIRDKRTKKYVGVASLGSDVDCKNFDDYIGWTRDMKYKKKKFNNLMNITTCVAIPPFSFNYNGGKLIAMLMFSKEVYNYFKDKYNDELVCITTFSLYGKSIQYDRLKELKYVGLTKGESSSHIPQWYHDAILTYLEQNNLETKFRSRMHRVRYLVKNCKFSKELMKGIQKGCYIGFTGSNSKEYLNMTDKKHKVNKLKTASEIGKIWRERWAYNRFKNLLDSKRLIFSCDYDNSIIDQKDYNRIKQLRIKDKNKQNKKTILTNDEKIEIIKYYIENNRPSITHLIEYFSDKYKRNISRKVLTLLIHNKQL